MVGDGKSAKDDLDTEQGGQGDNSPADTRHLPVALASQVDPRSLDLMVGSNYGNFSQWTMPEMERPAWSRAPWRPNLKVKQFIATT